MLTQEPQSSHIAGIVSGTDLQLARFASIRKHT